MYYSTVYTSDVTYVCTRVCARVRVGHNNMCICVCACACVVCRSVCNSQCTNAINKINALCLKLTRRAAPPVEHGPASATRRNNHYDRICMQCARKCGCWKCSVPIHVCVRASVDNYVSYFFKFGIIYYNYIFTTTNVDDCLTILVG